MTNSFPFSLPASALFCRRGVGLIALLVLLGFYSERAIAQDIVASETSAAALSDETRTRENAAPSLPEEFNEEARAVYEEKLKTLRARMDDQKWEEALTTADELVKARPREPQVRFIRTIALTELGRDEEAKSALLALISDFPELPEPRNNLAAMYAKAGEFALAQRELETAIAAAPDYSVAHANLADLYVQMALRHYQKAADTDKDSATRRDLNARLENLRTLLTPQAMVEKIKDNEEMQPDTGHAKAAEQGNSEGGQSASPADKTD